MAVGIERALLTLIQNGRAKTRARLIGNEKIIETVNFKDWLSIFDKKSRKYSTMHSTSQSLRTVLQVAPRRAEPRMNQVDPVERPLAYGST